MNGVKTKDRLVSIWVNSHYLCSALLTELLDLGNKQQPNDNKQKRKIQDVSIQMMMIDVQSGPL